jgi:hypothetical protein
MGYTLVEGGAEIGLCDNLLISFYFSIEKSSLHRTKDIYSMHKSKIMGFSHKKPEQIYVDTCFWCRPFDDQTTYRLLKFADTEHIELIRSPFVHFELSFIDAHPHILGVGARN